MSRISEQSAPRRPRRAGERVDTWRGPRWDSGPAVRVGRSIAGLTLLTFGLVHLLVWPGAPLDGGPERLQWNGGSWSGWMPSAAVWSIGGTLLAATVLSAAVGGAGLLGLPGARRFPFGAAGVSAGCSLGLFALAWPGLEPDPAEFVAGPVLSGLVLAGAVAGWWPRRRAGAQKANAQRTNARDTSTLETNQAAARPGGARPRLVAVPPPHPSAPSPAPPPPRSWKQWKPWKAWPFRRPRL